MILRGIRARRLLSCTIFSLMALVVAGSFVAVGFSRLTHVSQGSAGALALLGLVGIATQSVESVHRREHELGLARLRGRRGPSLLLLAVAEPGLVVIGGAVAGALLGWAVLRVVVGDWLPAATSYTPGSREWAAGGIVTAAGLVVVVATSWRTTRVPLAPQLSGVRRSRAVTIVAYFLEILLVLGAVVALYQTHQAAGSPVDWVTLVSPAVVGLAAGQLMIWLVVGVLAVLVPRSEAGSFGWFIALRRLFRRADSLALIRIVVAAGVVFGVAASAWTAAGGYREDRARLQVGAPVSYPVRTGALQAYAAAQRADPEGKWLVPVAAFTVGSDPPSRRAYVSASRWRDVVGPFFASTPAAPLTGLLAGLPPAPPVRYGKGDSVTVSVATDSLPATTRVVLQFQYADDSGNLAVRSILLRAGRGTAGDPGVTQFAAPVPDCQRACSLREMDLGGFTAKGQPVRLVGVSFVGEDLLSAASGARVVGSFLDVHRTPDALTVGIPDSGDTAPTVLLTYRAAQPLAAVATSGVRFSRSDGLPTVLGPDGFDRTVRVVARVPVLPFVGTAGSVLDLDRALAGAGGALPDTRSAVLARSDTPAEVTQALLASGVVGTPTTYAESLKRLDATPRAQGTRLYVLIAAFAALIALVSLASNVAQQIRERRVEAASLRSVGIVASEINAAYRREAMLLAVAAAVATLVAAWVCSRELLPALPLVSGWDFGPPLDADPRLTFIAGTAVAAGAVVGLVSYAAFRSLARSSPPRLLREDVS